MKFLFFDSSMDFNNSTIDNRPMGGTQSAFIYLAREIRKKGFEVVFTTRTKVHHNDKFIQTLPLNEHNGYTSFIEYVKTYKPTHVITQAAADACYVTKKIDPNIITILWTQHDANLVDKNNKYEVDKIDLFAFVSSWQRFRYIEKFNIPVQKTYILRNCMNPHLETLLRKSKEQKKPLKKKQKMIYTSTPFRGLHLVPTIFKNVNKYTDGYTMDVYSSLKTYFMDDKQYPDLAKTLKEIDETDGINNNGAIPQKELSQKYLESRIMMYPNIFKETSCVSAIEALSSGNIVVTSDKGALPETCCGFGCHFKLDFMTEFSYEVPNHFVAKLPNIGDFDKSQLGSYTRRVIDVIKNYNNKYVKQIKEQIEFCLENYTYEARANNFLLFLRGSKHETPQRFKQLIETNKILDAINFYEHGYMFAEVNNDTHELYRNTIEKLKFNHFEKVHEYSMKKQIMQLYLKDDYGRIIQFFKLYFDKEHLLPKFGEFFQNTTSKFMELLDK